MHITLAALAASMLAGAHRPPIDPAAIERLVGAKPGGPGCAVAIVHDGGVSFSQAFGLADLGTKRPITTDTTFNVASMTKQFTGLAIALLIADGKLSEQDDIRKFFPELKDYGAPIRVANLLNHSTGLRNHMALAAFQPGDHLPSHEEALKLVFRQSALNFAPGTRHQYESPNYVLLAEVVSRVSGLPYEDFLAQRIFKPLGMTESGFASSSLAKAYAPATDGGFKLNEKTNGARGSSGLLSSVTDFAKWMANYDRLAVGGKPALDKMLSTSTLSDGSPISYRYGLVKEFDYAGVKGLTRISHGGQTAAYRSAFSYFPGRGFGDVVMCNFTADAHAIDQAIVSSFVGTIKSPQPSHVGGSGTAPGMPLTLPPRLAGTYYDTADDDIREFTVKDGSLALRFYGEEFPLQFLGAKRFAIPGQAEFRFGDGALDEVADGQARLHFVRLPAFSPQRLLEFAGTYRSADVDGAVTVAMKDGRLSLTYAAGQATLREVGKDHFASPEQDFGSVRFQRTPDGRVDGLTVTVSSGITRLRFQRVAG